MEKKTILQEFDDFLDEQGDRVEVDKIIKFIEAKNILFTILIPEAEKDKTLKDAMCEEADEFISFLEETGIYEAVKEELHDRIGSHFAMKAFSDEFRRVFWVEEETRCLSALPAVLQMESQKLCETILNIPYSKTVVIAGRPTEKGGTEDKPGLMMLRLSKPGSPEEEKDFLLYCSHAIRKRGLILVYSLREEHEADVYGFEVLPHGIWRSISREEIERKIGDDTLFLPEVKKKACEIVRE